jgi:hypothetical protein
MRHVGDAQAISVFAGATAVILIVRHINIKDLASDGFQNVIAVRLEHADLVLVVVLQTLGVFGQSGLRLVQGLGFGLELCSRVGGGVRAAEDVGAYTANHFGGSIFQGGVRA